MKGIRKDKGTTLALVAVLATVLVGLGYAMFCLMQLVGGSMELQNAVDSGSLNVAKNAAAKPDIELLPGAQKDNFNGLVNENSKIDLVNYNRVVAQALLVSLNAEAENTPRAKAHAQTVLNIAQLDDSSVGSRLYKALADHKNTDKFFDSDSLSGSLRLLTKKGQLSRDNSKFKVGFLSPGGPANVWLDPTILPDTSKQVAVTNQKSASSGFQYISGYSAITPAAQKLSAVAIDIAQPHLVSQRTFSGGKTSPQDGHVPPNSFLNAAESPVDTPKSASGNSGAKIAGPVSNGSSIGAASAPSPSSAAKLEALAASMTGALGKDFPVSIPRGYVLIMNEDPMPAFSARIPTGASLFNNELMTGIYVDKKSNVFSTNAAQFEAWQKYNTTGGVGQKPDSSEIKGGAPTKITDPAPQLCTWYNAFSCATCNKNLQHFIKAYPYDDAGQLVNFDGDHRLTAVEYYKVKFMELVQKTAKNGDENVIGQYLGPKLNLLYKLPPELVSRQTGMKLFYPKGQNSTSYKEHFTAPPGYAKYPWDFATIGTPDQLLRQVCYPHPGGVRPGNLSGDEEYNKLLGSLIQRVREIKPTASEADIKKLFLSAPPLPPGDKLYIYMPDGKNLAITHEPPPWAVPGDGQYPDGLTDGQAPPLEFVQRFPIYKNIVNAQGSNPSGFKGENGKDGDGGFHQVPYKYGPTNYLGKFNKQGKELPGPALRCGIHTSSWMPSSGFDNFLGKLNFTELVDTTDVKFHTPN